MVGYRVIAQADRQGPYQARLVSRHCLRGIAERHLEHGDAPAVDFIGAGAHHGSIDVAYVNILCIEAVIGLGESAFACQQGADQQQRKGLHRMQATNAVRL